MAKSKTRHWLGASADNSKLTLRELQAFLVRAEKLGIHPDAEVRTRNNVEFTTDPGSSVRDIYVHADDNPST